MKLKYSLISRRRFLDTLGVGWSLGLLAGMFYPLIRAVFPVINREPDYVLLNLEDFTLEGSGWDRSFAWGGRAGILIKEEDGSLRAFKGVCTHLDCNVTYLPEQRKFFCACHKGWYDHNGTNISGPPPEPLEEFAVTVKGTSLIISKQEFDIEFIPEIG